MSIQVMDGDKEAYLEEASKTLKRQRENITDLEHERRDLTRTLRVTKSRQNRTKDAENAAKLAKLAEDFVSETRRKMFHCP